MDLLAAIDLRGGGAVRLLKGDYAQETGYGDPVDLASSFIDGGTDWLHLVDLDAARDGGEANREIILEIAAGTSVPVETGGGIRTLDDVDQLLGSGVRRVILGTIAMDDPSVLENASRRWPGQVAVGLDYRLTDSGSREVAVRGWLQGSGVELETAIDRVVDAGASALIVTAIDRDGTLSGPDIEGLLAVLSRTDIPVIASGGVGGLQDLRALAGLKESNAGRTVSGAVVGKALVEGRMTISEAVSACR